jgi:hypothetical protein
VQGVAFCCVLSLPLLAIFRDLSRVGASCAALASYYDARLVNYLLEWGYQYVGGSGLSDTIWSPPFFFPEQNVLAWSDTFFTAYPFYFAARWLGASPNASLLFFQVLQLWLTPLVTYACARWLGLARPAAFVCAMTFGWSWARFFQTMHVQFAMGYLAPLYFALVYRGLRDRRPIWLTAALWTFLAAFFVAVYIAYFLVVLTAAMLACVMLLRIRTLGSDLRGLASDFSAAARRRESIAACAVALPAVALLAVGVAHYAAASRAVGGGDPQDAIFYGASFWGWLRPDPRNWIWGIFVDWIPPEAHAPWEKASFIGWAALLACLATPPLLLRSGASRSDRSQSDATPVQRSVLFAAALVVPLVILLVSDYPPPFDDLGLPMRWARAHLPGADAIRASGRICLVLSFFSSFVAAAWVQRLAGSSRTAWRLGSVALAALLLFENLPPAPPVADRCTDDAPWQEIEAPICMLEQSRGVGTVAFLPAELTSAYRVYSQVPEMTLALHCGLRTINGYSGRWPPRLRPIVEARPAALPCDALAGAIDAAQSALHRPTLIYVEQQRPLDAPEYGVGAVGQCLSRCLADPAPVAIAGDSRSGVGFLTDSTRLCGAGRAPAEDALPESGPPGHPRE